MKQRISPFQYSTYRDFLREALKAKGFSYRSFAAKHGNIISFIMLAQALTKGRSGTENKPMRNISPETLARLGKVLKLRDDEIAFLALLKLENDSVVLPGPYGSAYIDSIRALIREQKTKMTHRESGISAKKSKFTQTAETIAELIDFASDAARARISKEVLQEAKGILSRQRNKAGVRTLASIVQRLEKQLSMGTP